MRSRIVWNGFTGDRKSIVLDHCSVQNLKLLSNTFKPYVSGREPELVIFEDTGPGDHALDNLNPSYNDARSHASIRMLDKLSPSMPSPQELWLQKVLGYWVDAMVTIEREDRESQEQHNVDVAMEGPQMEAKPAVTKDSYRLWIRTHSSIMAMVSSSSDNNVAHQMDEGDAGLATASLGAVLGLRWHFDMAENRFHLQTLT